MPFVILPTNSASGGYDLTNSLRFNRGSSDGLSKTFASNSNRRTFTFSCWFKLTPSSSSGERVLLGGSDGTGYLWFLINSVGNIYLQNNPSSTIDLFTNQKLRDYSAWYHIVLAIDTTQATNTNRVKIYLNGSQITSFESPYNVYPSQNQDLNFTTSTHALKIGEIFSANYFDGYMSDVFYIDGQQLEPTSFGETDFDTGIWKPKAYTGTYGTNGFYLQFKNSASLGTDSSGNGNTFTVNNLTSVDQSTDTPTNNFSTMNPLRNSGGYVTLTEGNLRVTCASDATDVFHTSYSTIGVTKGKWYAEFKIIAGGVNNNMAIGGGSYEYSQDGSNQNNFISGITAYFPLNSSASGDFVVDGTSNSGLTTSTTNDIIGVALNVDDGQISFYKNGTQISTTRTLTTTASNGITYFIATVREVGSASAWSANFGSPEYSANSYTDGAGYGNFSYSVPSGYYSLNTKNLATFG
jgi:hypothetical protein